MKRPNTVRSAYPFGATPAQYLEHNTMPVTECGCLIWLGYVSPKTGYGQMALKGKFKLPHRVAWEVSKGPIPDGMFVLHRCDIRTCVNPDHLFLGTHQENMRDMRSKRRAASGVRNASAKLTPEQVSEIRASSMSTVEAASIYGVTTGTISNVRLMKHWR